MKSRYKETGKDSELVFATSMLSSVIKFIIIGLSISSRNKSKRLKRQVPLHLYLAL